MPASCAIVPGAYGGEVVLFCCGKESDLGWHRHAQSISLHVLDGDHYKAMETAGSSRIAAVLSGSLSRGG